MAGSYESVKRQAKNAQETGKTVSEWVEHGMNATAVAIRDSDSQSITYDNHGLLARTYDDITGEYEPEQLKVVNNTLAITDDNWKTVKAAIGKIHYEDPKHPGDMLSAYGVLGETIIGKLLLGEALGIYNDGGSLKFDKNGLSISNTIEISNGNNKTTIGAKSIASPSVSATAAYGNSVATNNLLVGHTNDSNGIKHISCGTVTCDGSGGTSVILSGVVGSSNCAFFLTNADASLSSAHIDGSQISQTTQSNFINKT